MSDQRGFPEPFGDDGGSNDGGSSVGGAPTGSGGPGRGRTIAIVVLAIVVVALLALVAALLLTRGPNPSPTPSPTRTTAAPTPTPTPTAVDTPTPTATAGGTPTCSVDDLAITLGQSQGAAGSVLVPLQFKNTSSSPCELHGFPGVSFVGHGNGTQLGAPADWDTSQTIVPNTLEPGATVVAKLQVSQAGNYDPAECKPLAADGFRVYPPHSTQSAFVKASNFTACQSTSVHLLKLNSPVLAQ